MFLANNIHAVLLGKGETEIFLLSTLFYAFSGGKCHCERFSKCLTDYNKWANKKTGIPMTTLYLLGSLQTLCNTITAINTIF